MDTEAYKIRPVEPDLQTRLENKQAELSAAYKLVLKDLDQLIAARDRFEGDNRELIAARRLLATQSEWLSRAPNE